MTKKEAEMEEKRKAAVLAKAGQQSLGIITESNGFAKSLSKVPVDAKSIHSHESDVGKFPRIGGVTPTMAERQFKVEKTIPATDGYLNEARLKEHVSINQVSREQETIMDRDVKHTTHLKRSHGAPSESTAKRSHVGSTKAEKLDAFI
jgi:hypothetical protein